MYKKIFTSYFGMCRHKAKAISISYSPPRDYHGKTWNRLAPTEKLVWGYRRAKITKEEYTEEYINLLNTRGITPEEIVAKLPDMSILLCYEKSGFCHRHILKNWIYQSDHDVVIQEIEKGFVNYV